MDDKIKNTFLERTSPREDGVALLDKIKPKCQRRWNRLECNTKMREWIMIKQNKEKSIDDFSIRLGLMSKQVVLNGYSPMVDELRDKFILGFRSKHFFKVQIRVNDLPSSWTTHVYMNLSPIAQTYLDNAIELKGSSDAKQQSSQNDDEPSKKSNRTTTSSKDQRRQRTIHTAIMTGTFRV